MEENRNKILIIEDDIQLTFFVTTVLEREGYEVKTFHNGKDGLNSVVGNIYSLIILDIDLPDLDGISICKKIREVSDVPIIFFTAKNRTQEKVKGLDAGANDYITKPVEVDELMARVRAHIRNKNPFITNAEAQEIKTGNLDKFSFVDLSLDTIKREVLRKNQLINLSPKEFDILLYFMKNTNKLLTKQQIFEEVWKTKFNHTSDKRVVDEHLNRLKNKIHLKNNPKLLHTIYGVGNILK